MAKNRMIRTETWTDEKFVSLAPLARLLFIGMWNHACDNGHLDDSALQLKMRVLPADPCDVSPLLDSIIATGMVVRRDGYLKVVNLSEKQPLDLRYLQFCDHCDNDPDTRYSREDKPTGKGKPREQRTSGTRATREQPASPLSRGVVGGDVGGGSSPTPRRKPERPLPADWEPNDNHKKLAQDKDLDLAAATLAFRDHAATNDRRARDWDAAFRTWLRKASEYSRPLRAVPGPTTWTAPTVDEFEYHDE